MTIKEVAEKLNMSPTTVSNVIHGKTKEVSETTVEKVRKYLDEIHFVPNQNAQNLALQRSNIIGVVLKAEYYEHYNIFEDPFVSSLIGSLETAIQKAGYFMMLYISDNTEELIRFVHSWNVDGLILFAMEEGDLYQFKRAYKKPMALVDTYLTSKKIISDGKTVNIGLDDEKAAYDAVRYLISKGHQKIAFLTRNMLGTDIHRYEGYKKAMEDAGLSKASQGFFRRFREGSAEPGKYTDFARVISAGYTAVFCCDDSSAIHLMNACRESGIRVPEDLSVVGFDNNAVANLASPALTTVSQDIAEKGRLAVRTLCEMIDGKRAQTSMLNLGTRLIERDSVRTLS